MVKLISEVADLQNIKRVPIPLQTLFYRCPEVVFGAPALTVAVDMWSVGVMLSELAGDPFTVCRTSHELVSLWCSRLGSPEIQQQWPLLAELLPSGSYDVAVKPLGANMGLSVHGVELLRGLLLYNPTVRLSAARVLRILAFDDRLRLQGESPGTSVSKPFLPWEPTFRCVFSGARHPWCVCAGDIGADVLQWLLADDVFQTGTAANADVIAALAGDMARYARVEEGRKLIFAGSVGKCGTKSSCGLQLRPFICLRVEAWVKAFRKKNATHFNEFADSVSKAVRRDRREYSANGQHFLKTHWEEWMLACGEFTVTRSFGMPGDDGPWVEPKHQDGGQSIFHMGISLAGRRRMVCSQAAVGSADLVLYNRPGTVYFGSLTGPEHQVFHQTAPVSELMDFSPLGASSVTVMLRTALFPYVRSRRRASMPHPKVLFQLLERKAREMFKMRAFALPSMDECLEFAPVVSNVPRCPVDEVHADGGVTVGRGASGDSDDAPLVKRLRIRTKSRPNYMGWAPP